MTQVDAQQLTAKFDLRANLRLLLDCIILRATSNTLQTIKQLGSLFRHVPQNPPPEPGPITLLHCASIVPVTWRQTHVSDVSRRPAGSVYSGLVGQGQGGGDRPTLALREVTAAEAAPAFRPRHPSCALGWPLFANFAEKFCSTQLFWCILNR